MLASVKRRTKNLIIRIKAEPVNTYMLKYNRTLTVFTLVIAGGILSLATTDVHAQPFPQPGQILINEYRATGPTGPNNLFRSRNEYVELYNNTNMTLRLSGMAILFVFNEGSITQIPFPNTGPSGSGFLTIAPRSYYLIANQSTDPGDSGNRYNLDAYAAPDLELGARGVSDDLFREGTGVALVLLEEGSPSTAIDGIGFVGQPQLRNTPNDPNPQIGEGNYIAPPTYPDATPEFGAIPEYSFVRRLRNGIPQDTNDNVADFIIVSTSGEGVSSSNIRTVLGAPGPQNSQSPITRLAQTLLVSRFDTGSGERAEPNRVRDSTPNSVSPRLRTSSDPSGTEIPDLGTFIFRRKFQNITGAPITRLRLRFFELTTKPTMPGVADARVINGISANVTRVSDNQSVPVSGLMLEPVPQPSTLPQQPQGGGINSSVVLQLGSEGLAANATVDVEFKFAIVQGGSFRFAAVVESLP